MPRHIVIKSSKTKHKERILKAAREKQQVTYKGNSICLTADLSAETLHNAMRLDISYKKKAVRNTNTWRLNNTFLNNQQVTGEIKREIKKLLKINDNENTTTQNLWDAAKAVQRGTFIATQSYLKKKEKHRIDNFTPKTTRKRRTKTPQN